MIIRPAVPDDFEAIAAIWNRAIRDTAQTFTSQPKTIADLGALHRSTAEAGHGFLVLEHDGALAGFGTYGQFRGGVGYARSMEHTLYVADGFQGLGLGKALLRALEEHAMEAGAHSLIGGIAGENGASVTFHTHMGYRKIAVIPEVGYKFGRYMDLILVQKILA